MARIEGNALGSNGIFFFFFSLNKQTTNKQEVYYRSYSITMGQCKAKLDQNSLKQKKKNYVFSYSFLLSSRCI